jgi:hypothetical protein
MGRRVLLGAKWLLGGRAVDVVEVRMPWVQVSTLHSISNNSILPFGDEE